MTNKILKLNIKDLNILFNKNITYVDFWDSVNLKIYGFIIVNKIKTQTFLRE